MVTALAGIPTSGFPAPILAYDCGRFNLPGLFGRQKNWNTLLAICYYIVRSARRKCLEGVTMVKATVDLHLHTTASDGATSALELVHQAAAVGLKTISFCDHESIEGYRQALETAEELGLELIPGVELLTMHEGREIHLLGYYVDPDSPVLNSWLKELREDRNVIAEQMVDKFNKHGYDIKFERVKEIATDNVAIGKNHFLFALIEAGYINTKDEIIHILRDYLAQHGLAHVDFSKNPYYEAVEIIIECGGIPVLAHPGLIRDDHLVLDLLRHPKLGLEVYYYYLGPDAEKLRQRYYTLARERNLVMTGGSDYHGRFSPDVKLGQVYVPEGVVAQLKAQIALREKGVLKSG